MSDNKKVIYDIHKIVNESQLNVDKAREALKQAEKDSHNNLTELMNKTKIVKENPKSTVVEYKGKNYVLSSNGREWKATLDGKVWVSGARNMRELRIFIAKHGK